MSEETLRALVGTALVDCEFGKELLSGDRLTLVAEFDLTDEEEAAVLAVEAGTVQEFAAKLFEWLMV